MSSSTEHLYFSSLGFICLTSLPTLHAASCNHRFPNKRKLDLIKTIINMNSCVTIIVHVYNIVYNFKLYLRKENLNFPAMYTVYTVPVHPCRTANMSLYCTHILNLHFYFPSTVHVTCKQYPVKINFLTTLSQKEIIIYLRKQILKNLKTKLVVVKLKKSLNRYTVQSYQLLSTCVYTVCTCTMINCGLFKGKKSTQYNLTFY